jgi:hypothetical protein
MRCFFFLMSYLSMHVSVLSAQPAELSYLGQTPGGSAFNLSYDAEHEHLYVGCGTSLWVYDVADPTAPERVAMRPFRGLINETVVSNDVVFAAATHDGLWALDNASPALDPLAVFPTPGEKAAYDIWRSDDIIYLADGHDAVMISFDVEIGFTEIGRFGSPNVMTVARRGDLIAVGSRWLLSGTVAVYHAEDVNTPLASWSDPTLFNIEDVRFADLRDDIIYVCGGTNNLGATGQFYALLFDGTTLAPVDHFTIGGIPGFAQAQITNMDSRNDTLFLCTVAGLHGLESDIPVLDATGLPLDSLETIGHIRPGLWYFDVALLGERPYLSIASEWYGLWINDITDLAPLDTVAVVPTGGWCQRSYVRGDTLWACMRGYGLVAYDIGDLLYTAGYLDEFELLHLATTFTHDCTFVKDSLVFVGHNLSYSAYNLSSWYQGDEPIHLGTFDASVPSAVECVATMETDEGTRVIGGLYNGTLELYDPFTAPDFPLLASLTIGGTPTELIVSGDTFFVGANIDYQRSLAAYRVTNDEFLLLAHAPAANTVSRIAKEGTMLAAALGSVGASWYRYDETGMTELGTLSEGLVVQDVAFADGLLYVADKLQGLLVYDVSNSTTPLLLASNPGSGGWQGMFGSTSVTVDTGGQIYLSDFNAGVFMIEAFDASRANDPATAAPTSLHLTVVPNPFRGGCTIAAPHNALIRILDLGGRVVWQAYPSSPPWSRQAGIDPHRDVACVVWQPGPGLGSASYVIQAKRGTAHGARTVVYLK